METAQGGQFRRNRRHLQLVPSRTTPDQVTETVSMTSEVSGESGERPTVSPHRDVPLPQTGIGTNVTGIGTNVTGSGPVRKPVERLDLYYFKKKDHLYLKKNPKKMAAKRDMLFVLFMSLLVD